MECSVLKPYSSSSFFIFIMAINLIFVTDKKKNSENPILDGCRFVRDRTRNDSTVEVERVRRTLKPLLPA